MGNLLGAPVTEKETESGATPDQSIQFAVSSMQGWRVHMEDAHICEGRLYATCSDKKVDLPGHALFGVFDGHGGSYSALYAGRNLCRVLSKQAAWCDYAQFVTSTTPSSADAEQLQKLLKTALTQAFVELDMEIACALKGTKVADADQPYHNDTDGASSSAATSPKAPPPAPQAVGDKNTENKPGDAAAAGGAPGASPTDEALQLLDNEGDSGTTACVVLVTPRWVICANAGDSRGILSQSTGKSGNAASTTNCKPLSYDHKPDDETEEARIRAAGGYVAGGRVEGDLAVSRGLGDFRFKQFNVVMKANNSSADTLEEDEKNKEANNNTSPANNNPDPASATAVSNNNNNSLVKHPGEQKVSPIPDILLHVRDTANDAFCVIACDGIWDVQTNEYASKLVAELLFDDGEKDLGLICEEVCDVCLRLGSKDNMTVLLVQFMACTRSSSKTGGNGGVLARRQARDAENKNSQNLS